MRSGEPANVTSTPRRWSASATASAGATCPTVPPASMRHRSCCSSAITSDVKEDADGTEHHDEARASIGEERERDSGQRGGPDDSRDVDGGLPADEGCDTRGEPLGERILAGERDPDPGVREGAEGEEDERHPDEAELPADDGRHHVGRRL